MGTGQEQDESRASGWPPTAVEHGVQLQTLQRRLLDWYSHHRRDLSWRHTQDPYAILVAEVMLQQTQVERVIPKYAEFLELFPTWNALAGASTGAVIRAWAPLGYNRRAVRLHAIARRVVEQYAGHLPEDLRELERLEGVGRYTAAAVACFAYGAHVPVLDTNVRRVLHRLLFGLGTVPDRDLRHAAHSAVEALRPGQASPWSQALMDLGATLCTTQRARCRLCPLRPECKAAPHLQQVKGNAVKRLAEGPVAYRTSQAPFRGSSRYFRGRIVQRLRELPEGQSLGLPSLGAELRDDFTQKHLPWLHRLVAQLHSEGLVYLQGPEDRASIEALADMTVRLPS